ncbi:RecB family exonuclease [Actinomycetospora soli]|uniref:RecB family exonuclease n=1 Tax=Actinomycetospora soli TaxID=2893887 RepID=UPI001E381753|nr:PD-(D/E)XK nuclease family protein [Actinomycetospora soli]MCD2187179.1 PD-(D/E)XK nuclease family protein [Actinomycetospora soli]
MSGQLSLADMPLPLVRVTPARLATWDDCRRRYRMTYLDRPTPPRGGAWAHATLGAVVHNVFRTVYETPAARRTPATAARLVDTLWSSEGFRDDRQADEYRGRAREWVARYVADTEVGEPLGVERWVAAPTGGIVAEGRVDRIDAGPDGDAVIVDYKTGRHVPTAADALGSRALALYALAAVRTLRRACRRVELHHPPSGTVAAAEHDETSLAGHRQAAEATARALADGTDALAAGGDPEALFPPTPGPGCARCDFRRSCPEGRAASASVPSWSFLAP